MSQNVSSAAVVIGALRVNVNKQTHCQHRCMSKSLYFMIHQLTLCHQMDFPIQINAIRVGLAIIFLRGHRLKFLNDYVFLSQKIVFISTKSVDPDEMLHFAAFHLGIHSLLKFQI